MTNKNAKTESERKNDELVDALTAGQKVFEELSEKFPGIQINPDASLLPEFMVYLVDIGVVTDIQMMEFQIQHAKSVIQGIRDLDKRLTAQKAEQQKAQLVVPNQGKPGLIIPGRG